DMWKKSAQLFPALAARGANVGVRKQRSQVLFQAAVNGFAQRERQYTWNSIGRFASCEWADTLRPGDGLAGRRGTCRLRTQAPPAEQSSHQQENANHHKTKTTPQESLLDLEPLRNAEKSGPES